ncbi:LytR C-terminal domain-containing protein [Kitasatospora arboriphila]
MTVRNGSGVGRQAGRATAELQAKGFSKAAVGGNTQAAAASSIGYPAGRAEEAAALATALGLPTDSVRQSAKLSPEDGLVVVLGRDYVPPAASAGPAAPGAARRPRPPPSRCRPRRRRTCSASGPTTPMCARSSGRGTLRHFPS